MEEEEQVDSEDCERRRCQEEEIGGNAHAKSRAYHGMVQTPPNHQITKKYW